MCIHNIKDNSCFKWKNNSESSPNMNKKITTRRFLTCLCFILFADIIVSVSVGPRDTLNLDINGFYLDDMISYSPASLGAFFNSSSINNFTVLAAEANRPEELQCPSMNVISTRYRCKVQWNIFYNLCDYNLYEFNI